MMRSSVAGVVLIAAIVGGLSAHAPAATPRLPTVPAAAAVGQPGERPGIPVEELARDARQRADKAAAEASRVVRSSPWLWLNIIGAGASIVLLFAAGVLRPGAFAKSGVRPVGSHPWWLWLACAMLSLSAAWIVAGMIAGIPGIARLPEDSPRRHALVGAGGYAAGLGVAFLMVRMAGAAAKGAGLTVTGRCGPTGFLAFVLVFPIVNVAGFAAMALHRQATGAEPQTVAHATLRMLAEHSADPWAWSMAALAIIAAPVFEELIYRGFVQTAVLHATGKPWVSIFLSSAVFAGMHAVGGAGMAWYAILSVFVLGVGMGLALERTRRLGVPIVMHALFNASNVVLLWVSTGAR